MMPQSRRIVPKPWPRKLYQKHGLNLPGACEVWCGKRRWQIVTRHGTIDAGSGRVPQAALRRAKATFGCRRFFRVEDDK